MARYYVGKHPDPDCCVRYVCDSENGGDEVCTCYSDDAEVNATRIVELLNAAEEN